MIRKEAITAGFLRVALHLSVFAVKFKLYHYRIFKCCRDFSRIH